jgi:hypothetical protein
MADPHFRRQTAAALYETEAPERDCPLRRASPIRGDAVQLLIIACYVNPGLGTSTNS